MKKSINSTFFINRYDKQKSVKKLKVNNKEYNGVEQRSMYSYG